MSDSFLKTAENWRQLTSNVKCHVPTRYLSLWNMKFTLDMEGVSYD